MYNEQLKENYIKYMEKRGSVAARKTLTETFNKTEPYEEKLEKDLYEFNYYEIEEMYKDLNFVKYNTLYNMNSRIKNYYIYCVTEERVTKNFDNEYLKFTSQKLASLLNIMVLEKRIFTREEVCEMCRNGLLTPVDRFILLGMYEGIGARGAWELNNVAIEDFNEKENKLNLPSDVKISVSPLLIEYAKDADKEEGWYTKAGVFKRYVSAEGKNRIVKDTRSNLDHSKRSDSLRMLKKVHKIFQTVQVKDEDLKDTGAVLADFKDYDIIYDSGIANLIIMESKKKGVSGLEYLTTPECRVKIEAQYGRKDTSVVLKAKYEAYFEQGKRILEYAKRLNETFSST